MCCVCNAQLRCWVASLFPFRLTSSVPRWLPRGGNAAWPHRHQRRSSLRNAEGLRRVRKCVPFRPTRFQSQPLSNSIRNPAALGIQKNQSLPVLATIRRAREWNAANKRAFLTYRKCRGWVQEKDTAGCSYASCIVMP